MSLSKVCPPFPRASYGLFTRWIPEINLEDWLHLVLCGQWASFRHQSALCSLSVNVSTRLTNLSRSLIYDLTSAAATSPCCISQAFIILWLWCHDPPPSSKLPTPASYCSCSNFTLLFGDVLHAAQFSMPSSSHQCHHHQTEARNLPAQKH